MYLKRNLNIMVECSIIEGKHYDVEINLLHKDEVIALR